MVERKLDHLGRLTIPKEYRTLLGISAGSRMGMSIVNGGIMITKSEACCVYCGGLVNLKEVKGVRTCRACINDIKQSDYFTDA